MQMRGRVMLMIWVFLTRFEWLSGFFRDLNVKV